ncbi:MAG: hypothetical protein FE834_00560, partial [Gammaproteobacteria bacterium]|nr:hypothetical protein [Gammaproteobacteria bacterium]
MNLRLISKIKIFSRNLLIITTTTLTLLSTNTVIAGGRTGELNLMDDFLRQQTTPQAREFSMASSEFTENNVFDALVFNRGEQNNVNAVFDEKFSLKKTLNKIRKSGGDTTDSSDANAQLLKTLLNTLKVKQKANGFNKMKLQERSKEAELTLENLDMRPTAIFNRFDLSASDGKHCGEYRIVYHKPRSNERFFLIFEAQYPNPKPAEGSKGCLAVADFWQQLKGKKKVDILTKLEKFFYQGLEHNGVSLPAAINFTHYTRGTGQVRSNQFIDRPWQLREFKTDINTNGKVVFVADTVKSNPLAELFSNQKNSDSDKLKALRTYFKHDFDNYIDNLLTPEKHSDNPTSLSASNIINGFSLSNINTYNELQSDSSHSDNTANIANSTALDTLIKKKLDNLNLSNSGYTTEMIRNRAEAMSCGGCHQNSNNASIAPQSVMWPRSRGFVHVDETGNLSTALTEQFLPARASLLENFLHKNTKIDAWRFAKVDRSSANNKFGGRHNAPNVANSGAFAALKADGSITAWGHSDYGGTGAPTDSGYTQIYSTNYAFAALKADGSIAAWGRSGYGGTGAPTDSGYTQIYSTNYAFAALKADGSIAAWGNSGFGGTGAPTDSDYTQIYSTGSAFAALKVDGSITAWGNSSLGGTGAPTDSDYTQIYSTDVAFAALKADGSIAAWGYSSLGGTGAPTDSGYTQIYSTMFAFAALKADGSIAAWGNSGSGGTGAPTDSGYTQIYSAGYAFAALKADGSITAWGNSGYGGTGAPTDSGYTQIYSTMFAFAALKADGSITAWGISGYGGTGAPTDSGYTQIYSAG